MRKNIVFVIVFAAIIYGLVQLHYYSVDNKCVANESGWQTIEVGEFFTIKYPADIDLRNDIPFAKLVDPEFKAILPDSIDYEQYRPEFIFLSSDFNDKDSLSFVSFANIVVRDGVYKGFPGSINEDLIAAVKASLENNLSQTSYHITSWNEVEKMDINGAVTLKVSFTQQNENKSIDVISTYLFKGDQLLQISLSLPENENKTKWLAIYDKIIEAVEVR